MSTLFKGEGHKESCQALLRSSRAPTGQQGCSPSLRVGPSCSPIQEPIWTLHSTTQRHRKRQRDWVSTASPLGLWACQGERKPQSTAEGAWAGSQKEPVLTGFHRLTSSAYFAYCSSFYLFSNNKEIMILPPPTSCLHPDLSVNTK